MFSDDILRLCIDGTEDYLEYLSNNLEKSEKNVAVKSIRRNSNEAYFDLYLRERLYNIDELNFLINGKRFSAADIRIVQYDNSGRILTVFPQKTFPFNFNKISPVQCFVITDTIYLVKRVLNWYKKRAEEEWCPELPRENPCFEKNTFRTASDRDFSEEQFECIKTALTSPLSYIWGAPGTGKTRYVLSECILEYLCRTDLEESYILVCAPTNVALEQTLFGILGVLDKMGMPLDRVLRLGTPSDTFCSKYSQVCEVAGVEQAVAVIRDNLKDLKEKNNRITGIKRKKRLTDDLVTVSEKAKEELSELDEDRRIKAAAIEELRVACAELEKSEARINIKLKAVQAERAQAQLDLQTNKARFSKIFKGSYYKEVYETYLRKSSELTEIQKQIDSIVTEKSDRIKEINIILEKLNDKRAEISVRDKVVKSIYADGGLLLDMFDGAAPSGISTSEYIDAVISKAKDAQLSLEEKLKHCDQEEIQNRIKQAEEKIIECENSDTAHRLENAQIVAVTADLFISRYSLFSDCERKAKHVFLDEAGYCGLIKMLPLLSLRCPVTLLGDHKQLPPINSAPDSLKKNTVLWTLPAIYCEDLFSLEHSTLFVKSQNYESPSFNEMPKKALTATYRFGKKLAGVLAGSVYSTYFHSAAKDEITKITVIDCNPVPNVSANSNPGKSNRVNISEANGIKNYILSYYPSDYVVLAPYKGQIAILKSVLKYTVDDIDDSIMTVHKSQGQEWDTVILSITDISTNNKIFTSTCGNNVYGKPVLNTAISRAKKNLVLACSVNSWKHYPSEMVTRIINCADEIITFEKND